MGYRMLNNARSDGEDRTDSSKRVHNGKGLKEGPFLRFIEQFKKIRRENGGYPMTASQVRDVLRRDLGVNMNLHQVEKYLNEGAERKLIRRTVAFFYHRKSKYHYALLEEEIVFDENWYRFVNSPTPRRKYRPTSQQK